MLLGIVLRLLAANGQQDELEGFAPGDAPGRAEGPVGIAVHHALLIQAGHVFIGPVVLLQIGEGGAPVWGGLGCWADGDCQQNGQRKHGDAFFHVVSFSGEVNG